MARWEPDSRGRLQQAALELCAEDGFDETTAAQIAERAGVTERTFFRHFGDKREALFANQNVLQDLLVNTVAQAPADTPPRAAVAAGLDAVSRELEPRRDFLRSHASIVASHPALKERELMKQAAWSDALAAALHGRGVPRPQARLAGEIAVSVLRVATEEWVEDASAKSLPAIVEETLDGVSVLVS